MLDLSTSLSSANWWCVNNDWSSSSVLVSWWNGASKSHFCTAESSHGFGNIFMLPSTAKHCVPSVICFVSTFQKCFSSLMRLHATLLRIYVLKKNHFPSCLDGRIEKLGCSMRRCDSSVFAQTNFEYLHQAPESYLSNQYSD